MIAKKSYTLITGAGSGIGKAIALHLGKSKNIICLSKSSNCMEVAKLVGENAKYLVCDLSDVDVSYETLNNFISDYDLQIDSVIQAAGIIGQSGPIETTNFKDWEKVFKVNFFSSVMLAKLFIPKFKKQKFGKMIYFSGGGGAYGYPVLPQYSASKTSLIRFVENIEMEISQFEKISTVIIAPGAVETNMFKNVKEKEAEYGHSSSVRSFSTKENVAKFVSTLLDSDIKKLSGRLVHIKDNWNDFIQDKPTEDKFWKLRRIEN